MIASTFRRAVRRRAHHLDPDAPIQPSPLASYPLTSSQCPPKIQRIRSRSSTSPSTTRASVRPLVCSLPPHALTTAPLPAASIYHHTTSRRLAITVKVKANMQFKKIFEVAEVRRVSSTHATAAHAPAIAKVRQRSKYVRPLFRPSRKGTDDSAPAADTLRFHYEGERLGPDDTPASVRVSALRTSTSRLT
jgi:hypothetical protein